MPERTTFERRVRARTEKPEERFTAALRHAAEPEPAPALPPADGPSHAAVESATHARLSDAEEAERAKAEWTERLTRLDALLES